MPDHDADADVIAAGPEPGRCPPWPGGLLWLIVLAETVALAVAVTAAVHYRAQARAPHPGRAPAASVTTSLPMPEMTTVALALPADGAVTGTVVITAAALPGGGLVEFTVSAVITGGQPGTVYDLDGNDCSTTSPLTDHVWATGVTSAAGVADLVGYAWTGAAADRYWLTLDPSPVNPPPGLRGQFAPGQLTPFPSARPRACPPHKPAGTNETRLSRC